MQIVTQYQKLAVPLGEPTQETIFLDKWSPRYTDKVSALLGRPPEGQSLYNFSVLVPSIKVSQWIPQYVDRTPKKSSGSFPSGGFAFGQGVFNQEIIFPDKYLPRYVDSVQQKYLPNIGSIAYDPFIVPVPAPTESWSPRFQDSVLQKTVFPSGGFYSQPPIPAVPESWLPKFTDSILQKKPFPSGMFSFGEGVFNNEVIYPDKWGPRFQDSVLQKKPFPSGMFSFGVGVFNKETIYPDKYHPEYRDRIWPPSRVVNEGCSALDLGVFNKETIYPDKWGPLYPSKVPLRLGAFPAGSALYDTDYVADIFHSNWQPVYPDLVPRKAKGAFPVGYSVIDFAIIANILADKWGPVYPDRAPRKAKGSFPSGWLALDLGVFNHEVVFIDKWKPEYVDRVPRQARGEFPFGCLVYQLPLPPEVIPGLVTISSRALYPGMVVISDSSITPEIFGSVMVSNKSVNSCTIGSALLFTVKIGDSP